MQQRGSVCNISAECDSERWNDSAMHLSMSACETTVNQLRRCQLPRTEQQVRPVLHNPNIVQQQQYWMSIYSGKLGLCHVNN